MEGSETTEPHPKKEKYNRCLLWNAKFVNSRHRKIRVNKITSKKNTERMDVYNEIQKRILWRLGTQIW